AELLEGALEVVAKGRTRKRLEERAAEIKRAQFRQGQACGDRTKGLSVDDPARPPVVVRPIVEQRKPRFLERLQIAADGPRRHAALRGKLVDRDPAAARTLDLAEDRPLTDHLGISRHDEILPPHVIFAAAASAVAGSWPASPWTARVTNASFSV